MNDTFVGISKLEFYFVSGDKKAKLHIVDSIDGIIHKENLLYANEPDDYYEIGGLQRIEGDMGSPRDMFKLHKQLKLHVQSICAVKPILMICGPDDVSIWTKVMSRGGLKVTIMRGSKRPDGPVWYPPLKKKWSTGGSDDEHVLMFELIEDIEIILKKRY